MTQSYRGHEPESGITNNFWQFGGGGHGQGGWRILSFLLVVLLALAVAALALDHWPNAVASAQQPSEGPAAPPSEEPSRLERGKADFPPTNGPGETSAEPPSTSDATDENEEPGTPDAGPDAGDSDASRDPPEGGTRRSDPPPAEGSASDAEASAAAMGPKDGDLMRDAMALGRGTARHPNLSRALHGQE